MGWIFFIVIVVLVVGILFAAGKWPFKKKSRGDFLKALSKLVDGNIEPILERSDSFRIKYNLDGVNFTFEDIQDRGFRAPINKAYLKVKTGQPFDLYFTSKEGSKKFGYNIVLASQVPLESERQKVKVELPRELSVFDVVTNNPVKAIALFEDERIVDLFLNYKNQDNEGYIFISLKIVIGEIVLEFHPVGGLKPNLLSLYKNIPNIENYSDQLLMLYQKVLRSS